MNSNKFKKKSMILILIIALFFMMFDGMEAKAGYQSWMADAEGISINKTINDSMKLDNNWGESVVQYFKIPAKMKVNIKIVVNGSRPFSEINLFDQNGNSYDDIYASEFNYNPSSKKCSYSHTFSMNKGFYYMEFQGNGTFKYSMKITVNLKDTMTLKKVAKSSKTSIKLNWSKVSGAKGYVIYRSNSKTGTYKKIKTLSSKYTSYNNSKLKKGKKYYYKIYAYKTISGKNYYTSASKVFGVKL